MIGPLTTIVSCDVENCLSTISMDVENSDMCDGFTLTECIEMVAEYHGWSCVCKDGDTFLNCPTCTEKRKEKKDA